MKILLCLVFSSTVAANVAFASEETLLQQSMQTEKQQSELQLQLDQQQQDQNLESQLQTDHQTVIQDYEDQLQLDEQKRQQARQFKVKYTHDYVRGFCGVIYFPSV